MFDCLISGAKFHEALDFVIKSVEDGFYGYCFSHKNVSLMEVSKQVGTKEDMRKCRDLVEQRWYDWIGQKRAKSFEVEVLQAHKMTCFFIALLKEGSIGCKDVVLLESFNKSCSFKGLICQKSTRKYNSSWCLFRALVYHWQDIDTLKKTSKLNAAYLENMKDVDALKIQRVLSEWHSNRLLHEQNEQFLGHWC